MILIVNTLLGNAVIALTALFCVFSSPAAPLLLISAGLLMIMTTYENFCTEKNKAFVAVKTLLTIVFSVLSGSFIGFAVFALLRDLKVYIRIICGVCVFEASQLLLCSSVQAASLIISGIFIIAIVQAVSLIFYATDFYSLQKQRKAEQILSVNISEMHEKRLNEELLKQNLLAERNARLIERENISRNIHNSVGHSITAAIMTLDAADMLYDVKPVEARKKMNDANERIRGSLEAIRRAVRVLDENNAEIISADMKSDMEIVINEFVMDTSIIVNSSFSQLPDDVKIPHSDAEFLTGMLQEMLTNGVKHGNADEFLVFLSGDSTHLRIEISDNGNSVFCSENAEKLIENGFGLKKIISYVSKHGGKTSFINDDGFKGIVELPIIISESE